MRCSTTNRQDIQDEILRINAEARDRSLQFALLVPIVACLIGLVQLVPHDATTRHRAIRQRRRNTRGLTAAISPTRSRALSARTLGALAVAGVVIAFSLSSTLVKRAHSPGVLLAFWRMVTVSVVWNVYLRSTGRRVTLRHVRQAFVPGVFFGLNLAIFFAGATHNSVANAALIGSLAPFFIVPIGAMLFEEYINPRALVFALVAFGGVAIVLFSAPPNGDASLRGNVFGVLAMLLWTAYVVSTRHFRRDMDVATFMATISPIAAVAVLPLGDRQRRRVRDEPHGMDVHADPHVPHRDRGARAERVRAEDHRRSARSGSSRWRNRPSPSCGRSCCWARRCAAGRSSASPS